MIPAGIHYIYYSSVSKDKDVSPRRGFFINIQPGQLIVHRLNICSNSVEDQKSNKYDSIISYGYGWNECHGYWHTDWPTPMPPFRGAILHYLHYYI